MDDLHGRTYFAVTVGCEQESEAHRSRRENQSQVANICADNKNICTILKAQDIRDSKRLKELRAEQGDVVVNKKLIRSDDLAGLNDHISKAMVADKKIRSPHEITEEERELAALNAIASQKLAQHILDTLTTRIVRAWRRPVAYRGGLEVYLRVELDTTGELTNISLVRSSGDKLFDQSAVSAVKRAGPF